MRVKMANDVMRVVEKDNPPSKLQFQNWCAY